MAIGLQSLATVREDTEVRDRFIDDSLKSYNPDSFIPENNITKPNRPQSVGLPPDIDPFSEDFSPFTTVNPFTDLEIDPPKMDITTAVENLNLDEGGNNAVSQYAANTLQDDNNSESDQKAAIEAALLDNALGPLDFASPNIIEHFKKFGIDLEQRKKDYEARKEGGMPFINAGLALTQASRAGLNVPQAIASAMATFSATKDKLNQLDPLMMQLAVATLPKSTGVGDIEGEFDRYSGDEYLGRRHLTDAMVLTQEAKGIDLRPVSTGENATSKYYVQTDDGVWTIRNLDDGAYQRLVDEKGFDKVQAYNDVAERQIVSVYDKDKDLFDTMFLSEYTRLKIDDPKRYSVETGDMIEAEYLRDDGLFEFGETKQVNKSWLGRNPGWSKIPNSSFKVKMVNGVPIFSNVSASIAGSLALEKSEAEEKVKETEEFLTTTNANLGQMVTTVGQLDRALGELDGRGGQAVRFVERLKDTIVGGAREVLGMYGAADINPSKITFASGNTLEQNETEFRALFKEMEADGTFAILNGLGGTERAKAALALENALFSLALQNAMNSYDQTARSISDRDLQFFLRNIGSAAGSTPTLVRAVNDEITRSTLSKFDRNIESMAYYQPTLSDETKPLVDDGYLVLKEGADPEARDSYTVDPNNPAIRQRALLEDALNNLSLKYGSVKPIGTTSFIGGVPFIEKMNTFETSGKQEEITRATKNGPITYTIDPAQLTNRIDLSNIFVPSGIAGQQELSNALGQLADNKNPSIKALLNVYNQTVYPRIKEEMDKKDNVSKTIAVQIHNQFLKIFLPRDEDKALFDQFQFGITNIVQ